MKTIKMWALYDEDNNIPDISPNGWNFCVGIYRKKNEAESMSSEIYKIKQIIITPIKSNGKHRKTQKRTSNK